jgi:DNA replication licensing factor MCM5
MHRRHHSTNDANDVNSPDGGGDPSEANAAAGGGGGSDWDPNQCYIYVDLAHVGEYDAALLGQLLRRPAEALPVMETAAADALRTLLYVHRRPGVNVGGGGDGDARTSGRGGGAGEAGADDGVGGGGGGDANLTPQQLFGGNSIQVLLRGNLAPTPLRSIQSHHMNSLLKCPGIITSCARVRPRAMALRIRCAKCLDSRTVFGNSSISGGRGSASAAASAGGGGSPFSGFSLPMRCLGPNPQECGPAPYSVLPDECLFVDQQTLKLQEAPEMVPTGEMPRSGECVRVFG